MFEHRRAPLIPRFAFLRRQLHFAALSAAIVGPVDRMQTSAGKLFATVYALASGVLFVTTVAVLFAPLVHRFFHHFHLELDGERD